MKTKEEKIKFLVELDGFEFAFGESCVIEPDRNGEPNIVHHEPTKPYLTSYDAIIPLIQKQPRHILTRIVLSMKGQNDVSRMVDWLMFSPEELADILIKVIENEKR